MGLQCPVLKGQYIVEQTVALSGVPPGKQVAYMINTCPLLWGLTILFYLASFNINARGHTVNDEDLFCVALKLDLMEGLFPKLGWW